MNLNTNVKSEVIGHPAGLFILFFTEMWERFSYYGMRALLVLFLVSAAGLGGWEWSNKDAMLLYGLYTGFVYLTPIFGGIIADKVIGFKKAVVIGAVLMTLGHASMAIETEIFFYIGLALLVIGNGFFKPNISSIVSGLYKGNEKKKDAGYTIFYMGINAGAFLGILLCGYIGEKVGWSYGFGLAGVFMFIGMLQFWFAQKMFGDIGNKPVKEEELESVVDGIGQDDLLDSNTEVETDSSVVAPVTPKVRKDRLIVVGVLAFFTIFFWMAFEQAGGSMTIFAKDYTDRVLNGGAATAFSVINAIIVIVPMCVLTYVLIGLFRATFKNIALSNIFLGSSFAIIWILIIFKIYSDFNVNTYGAVASIDNTEINTNVSFKNKLDIGSEVYVLDVNNKGDWRMIGSSMDDIKPELKDKVVPFTVTKAVEDEVEVPASWFGILNSLFIIIFAPLFSKIWESRFNPSAPIKFALGLILLGVGFGILSYGGWSIEKGQTVASVSMVWLIVAYLFHTLGELTLSPVGLSYVSKLSPPKLLSLMFGVWFTATFFANLFAGLSGSLIDSIAETYSISVFFLIFTAIPIVAGLILIAMNKWLVKKMHGIR